MRKPIFKDDSSPADKRKAATARLLSMCPASYRMIMAPFVETAVEKCSDSEIDALLIDAKTVEAMANNGDWTGVTDIARKYGATDEMMRQYVPGLNSGGTR